MIFTEDSIKQPERRRLIQLAGLGLGMGLLPAGWNTLSAGIASNRTVETGYWRGGTKLADLSLVRRGWGESCAKSATACDNEIGDELVAAGSPGARGDYVARLVGAEFTDIHAVEFAPGGERHDFWSSWRRGSLLESAALSSVRWHSSAGEGLPMSLISADRRVAATLPAQRGVYVVPLDQAVPDWSQLALAAPDSSRPLNLRLVARGASARVPSYLMFAVERRTV